MKRNDSDMFSQFKVLECFDRMVVTGVSRDFGWENSMKKYCYDNRIDGGFLADWARPLTERIKAFVRDMAEISGRPMIDCNTFKGRKDDFIKKCLMESRLDFGIPIAVFSSMENCRAFYRSQSAKNAKLRGCPFRMRGNKCLHFYIYFIDKVLGLVCLRIQSYAPFGIQCIINGHHILERMLKSEGISFEKRENCFLRISDMARANELSESITGKLINDRLDIVTRNLIPLRDIMPSWYQFYVRQVEFSTDVYCPHGRVGIDRVRSTILQLCMQRPDDFMTYVTEPARRLKNPEFSYRQTHLGICAKFNNGSTSIKVYHKSDRVLRIETTCSNLRKVSVRRVVRSKDGVEKMKSVPLTRSLLDINLFFSFGRRANNRMRDRLSTLWDQSYSNKQLQAVSQPAEFQKINFSGVNFFSPKDEKIIKAISSPNFDLSGFKRSDIVRITGLNAHQAGYAIRRMRAHKFIKKATGTNRYFLTKGGRSAFSTALVLEHLVATPLMSA